MYTQMASTSIETEFMGTIDKNTKDAWMCLDIQA